MSSREPKEKIKLMDTIILYDPNYKPFVDEYKRVRSSYKSFSSIEDKWDKIYYFMPQIFSKAYELSLLNNDNCDYDIFEDIFQKIIIKLSSLSNDSKYNYDIAINRMKIQILDYDYIEDHNDIYYSNYIEDDIVNQDTINDINTALDYCNPREKKYLKMYFFENKNMREIGEMDGITTDRVSQIIKSGLRKCNRKMININGKYNKKKMKKCIIVSSGKTYCPLSYEEISNKINCIKLEKFNVEKLNRNYYDNIEIEDSNDSSYQNRNFNSNDMMYLFTNLKEFSNDRIKCICNMKILQGLCDRALPIFNLGINNFRSFGILYMSNYIITTLKEYSDIYKYLFENSAQVGYLYEFLYYSLLNFDINIIPLNNIYAKYEKYLSEDVKYYLSIHFLNPASASLYNLKILYDTIENDVDNYSIDDRFAIFHMMKDTKMIG